MSIRLLVHVIVAVGIEFNSFFSSLLFSSFLFFSFLDQFNPTRRTNSTQLTHQPKPTLHRHRYPYPYPYRHPSNYTLVPTRWNTKGNPQTTQATAVEAQ